MLLYFKEKLFILLITKFGLSILLRLKEVLVHVIFLILIL